MGPVGRLRVRAGRPSSRPAASATPEAIAANQWLDRPVPDDKVIPPSAPNDGFQEIIGAFKAGKTAMTIHHIGSSNDS